MSYSRAFPGQIDASPSEQFWFMARKVPQGVASATAKVLDAAIGRRGLLEWVNLARKCSRLLYLSAVVIGASVVVSACGFRPMYGGPPGKIATAELAAIKIEPISGRIGQSLRNQLLDRLTPLGSPAYPGYLLTVNLKESIKGLAVRKNTFATRANLNMTASFSLSEVKSKPNKVLFSGRSEIVSSYNIFTSNFATLIAEKEARNRAALEIGKDISVRLTVFMEQRQGPPGK